MCIREDPDLRQDDKQQSMSSSIYLILNEDPYLADQALEKLRQSLKKEKKEFEDISFDAAEMGVDALLNELNSFSFFSRKFFQIKQNHIFNQISKNIQKGINEGLYRTDVNIDLTAGLYVRNLIDMHNKDYCFVENITFDQVFEAMFENHIRAISTAEGIEYFEKRKSEINQSNKQN